MLVHPRGASAIVPGEGSPEDRDGKKRREYERLRGLTPAQRLEMGSQRMAMAAELREGGRRAGAKA